MIMPVRFLVFLLLLVPSAAWSQKQPVLRCEHSADFINYTASNIKSYYQVGDVSLWVNKLEGYMARCQISPASYGWGKGTFAYWRDTGIKAEQKVVRERLARQAAVGKISEADRDLLRQVDKIVGVPKAETDRYLQTQLELVQKNQSSCEPQDLRNDKLGPVHNQERLGWCYAFSGADLLSYKLGEKISAADMATVFTDGWKKELATTFGKKETEYSAGGTKEAIEKMRTQGGVCREKDFPSDPIDGTSLDTALNKLQDKKAHYNSKSLTCGQDMVALSKFLPNVRPQDYIDLLETSTRASFIKDLRNKTCSSRVDISKIEVVEEKITDSTDLASKRALFDSIDKQLDNKNVAEMGYWAAAFTATDPERLQSRQPPGHSSLIVGRRFNPKTQSCEYLVRNSFGPQYQTARNLENDQGHYWIPKEDLIREIFSVTYLK